MQLEKKQSPVSQRTQLQKEIWFHGFVNRQEAESMLSKVSEKDLYSICVYACAY